MWGVVCGGPWIWPTVAQDKSLSNDLPGIDRMAQKQASSPPPVPPVPAPEKVAPKGVLKGFNFDHRNGTGGTHELG